MLSWRRCGAVGRRWVGHRARAGGVRGVGAVAATGIVQQGRRARGGPATTRVGAEATGIVHHATIDTLHNALCDTLGRLAQLTRALQATTRRAQQQHLLETWVTRDAATVRLLVRVVDGTQRWHLPVKTLRSWLDTDAPPPRHPTSPAASPPPRGPSPPASPSVAAMDGPPIAPATHGDTVFPQMLEALQARRWGGRPALAFFYDYLTARPTHRTLLLQVLAKEVRVGLGVRRLSALLPDDWAAVGPFPVALGYAMTPKDAASVVRDVAAGRASGGWFISQKFDGLRCIATIDPPDPAADARPKVTLYSRSGRRFVGVDGQLACVAQAVSRLFPSRMAERMVLDGELVAVPGGPGRSEDFQAVTTLVRTCRHASDASASAPPTTTPPVCPDVSAPTLLYYVFDAMRAVEHQRGHADTTWTLRQAFLADTLRLPCCPAAHAPSTGDDVVRVYRVPHVPFASMAQLDALRQDAQRNGWEGLMLRRDGPYKGCRTKDILKVKEFMEDEFTIVGTQVGHMTVIENNQSVLVPNLLRSIDIDYKGHVVSVGSGLRLAERKMYANVQAALIGTDVTVQYFSETQSDPPSLRFPTIKKIHWSPLVHDPTKRRIM